MSDPRTCLRFGLALAVLLFGLPLGAIEAPVAPSPESGGAAGPVDLAAVWEAPATPDSARKAPEHSQVVTLRGATHVTGLSLARGVARQAAALGAGPPLYLSHCAFLC